MEQKFGEMSLKSEIKTTSKRKDYICWDDYFMAMACLAAKRSKDPCSQVGACIVDADRRIVGIGYNGMPTGCSDDEFPWDKHTVEPLQSKYFYVCHAETNAILNKNCASVKGCTIYVGLFPCNECAKIIIQSGIKRIVYLSDKYAHKDGTIASKKMFDAVKITYQKYQMSRNHTLSHADCKEKLFNLENNPANIVATLFVNPTNLIILLYLEY